MEKKNLGILAGAAVSGLLTFLCGIIGFTFKMIGMMYLANPENVNIEVNGRVLEGAEAVAAAEKAGSFMSTTGGILLIIAVVTLITAIVLAVLYGKKRAQ